jgi:TPR repeat protein
MRALTHLPFLRIAERRILIGGGALVAVPFDDYDDLLLGSFTDHRAAYDAAEPTFFVTDEHFHGDHASGCWRVHAALSLALPTAALASPTLSLTAIDEGDVTRTMQGAADQELLFVTPTTARAERADVDRASELLAIVDRLDGAPRHALGSFLEAADPSLGHVEQLTLCTVAIEALLLPDITNGLTETFARRLANLLAADDVAYDAVHGTARTLYAARSASVHGTMDRPLAPLVSAAQTLLAHAIVAVGRLAADVPDLDEVRERLDTQRGPVNATSSPAPGESAPAPRLSIARPLRHRSGQELTAPLRVPDDEVVLFAPLIGLSVDDVPSPLIVDGYPLSVLTFGQLHGMEDPDIRRDWMARLTLEVHEVPALAVRMSARIHDHAAMESALHELRAWITDAVLALRLAGMTGVDDPDLVGDFARFDGDFYHRIPTIYRQTALLGLAAPAQVLDDPTAGRLAEAWRLLLAARGAGTPDSLERALSMFRRAHAHRLGVGRSTQMQLLFAALELLTGRMGSDRQRELLEACASRAGDVGTAASWFGEHGRAVRNAVAHGYWDADGPDLEGEVALAHVRAVVRAAILADLTDAGTSDRGSHLDAARAARYRDLDGAAHRRRAVAAFERGDLAAAAAAFARGAECGDSDSMYGLGRMAADAGDEATAMLWLMPAARSGSASAMNAIGVIARQHGELDAARDWYAAAWSAGAVEGMYNLGILEVHAGNVDAARDAYEQAAERGEVKAMHNLGVLEEEAGDLDAARRWYRRAAGLGNAKSMNELGVLAMNDGDVASATEWWERAAAAGSATGMRNCGILAAQHGDLGDAREWLSRAIAAGDGGAGDILERLASPDP